MILIRNIYDNWRKNQSLPFLMSQGIEHRAGNLKITNTSNITKDGKRYQNHLWAGYLSVNALLNTYRVSNMFDVREKVT